MKGKILASCLTTMLLSAALASGQATQPCVVMQYNQKSAKTPLSGVEVVASNAGSTVSDADGRLTLSFRTLKPGDKVNLISAKKVGYEIFNSEAVTQWNISRDQTPFTLVLVKKAYFDQLKAKLTETSSENYKAKYLQAMKEVEKLKQEGKLKEEEYFQKLDELEADYQTHLENLDNYIDQFARIDLSEVSAEEQHILDMVQEGRIDEAVKAYEELDISGKLRKARENKKALSEARTRIEEEEKNQELAIQELKAKQERELATLQLAGGKENYDKVAAILRENALADTTDFASLMKYANFCYKQKEFAEAIDFYLTCLRNVDDDIDLKSLVHNNLGLAYSEVHAYDLAEANFLKSLEYEQELFNQYPETYQPGLAMSQHNLGSLYYYLEDYPKAEEFFLLALKNKELLVEQDPDDAQKRFSLASTQVNLGELYRNMDDYQKAESFLLKALENCTIIFAQDNDSYRDLLATIQLNLGNLYMSTRAYDKVVEYYSQAEENFKALFDKNPDAQRENLAGLQFNLGLIYQVVNDFEKAETFMLKALENMTVLYEKHPSFYLESLAKMERNMGLLYYRIRWDDECVAYLLKSLEHYKVLYDTKPAAYGSILASIYQSLAQAYHSKGDTSSALENIDLALEMQPNNPRFYDTKGVVLLSAGDEPGALEMWQKVLELDPEFKKWLSGAPTLQKQLKERGLIE